MHDTDRNRGQTLGPDVRCNASRSSRSARFDNGPRHFLVRFVAQIELQFLEPSLQFFVLKEQRDGTGEEMVRVIKCMVRVMSESDSQSSPSRHKHDTGPVVGERRDRMSDPVVAGFDESHSRPRTTAVPFDPDRGPKFLPNWLLIWTGRQRQQQQDGDHF